MRFPASLVAIAALLVPAVGCTREAGLIPSLEALAERGNAEAIYHLGMAYHTGSGVPRNGARALELFRKAAAMGDPLASYKLGCYFDGQGDGLVSSDLDQALKFKLVAAEAGYALAQQDVGQMYGGKGDVPTALVWLERSAAQGWSGGLASLASAYNGAPGVPRDPAKTAAYFRLFLARSQATPHQTEWVHGFENKLSSEDRRRSQQLVDDYRPAPTALTIRALSGQRAAQALVAAES